MDANKVITKLEKQKKNEKRYSVFLDGQFAFGMTDVDVLFYKLHEGMELTPEKYEYILDNVIFTKARDSAVRYLGYSPRTEKEIRKKLATVEVPEEIIERVMELLTQYGYINDYDYAQSYIKDKIRLKGYGIRKIKYDLALKGVDRELVDEILEDYDFDEEELAYAQIVKKTRGNTDLDEKEQRKMFDYLMRRGFGGSVAGRALKRFIRGE